MTEKPLSRKWSLGGIAPEDEGEHVSSRSVNGYRAKFAKAMTRAQFGRYYWDESMTEELRASLTRPRDK